MSPRFLTLAALGTTILTALPAALATAQDFDTTTQIGPDPVLPEPQFHNIWPEMKVAEVTGWEDGQTPTAADGLTVTPYAQDLANPRTVHTLPNGDVLVVQSRGPEGKPKSRPKDFIRGWIMAIAHGGGGGPQKESNLITLLRDENRDGIVDERSDLLTGLASPFGVAWIDDTLYVATAEAVVAYPYTLGQSTITEAPRVLTPLPGGPINHHWTKDLALSPDGTKLYASVGSNSNVAENGIEAEKGRAAIWEIDRETGASRIYAGGLRNPNGLTFNPDTGALWTVVNERDELGPNLVPDYMTSVKDGAHYGWPWSYYGDHVDQRVRPEQPDMVEAAIAPDYALSSHVAALGLTFSNGSALPDAYANGAFIGEHGSWNRDHFNGYKVVYVPFENGMPAGMPSDVLTGFVDGDQAHGRPVGVGIDGTGALLVADDAGNTVWRVAASDGAMTDAPVGTDGQRLAAAQAEPAASEDAAQPAGDPDAAQPDAPADAAQPASTPDAAPAEDPQQSAATTEPVDPEGASPALAPAEQAAPATAQPADADEASDADATATAEEATQ